MSNSKVCSSCTASSSTDKSTYFENYDKGYWESRLTSLCKSLYSSSHLLKCEQGVPGVTYCSDSEMLYNAAYCRSEQKASSLIYTM